MEGRDKVRDLVLMGFLIAIGTLSAHLVSIPVGGARLFPVQHAINVAAAVFLGPGQGVLVAFSIGFLRNILGTGTVLAFPGGIVGAFLAGYSYRITQKPWVASAGEVFGTGVLGALIAYPLARWVLGQPVAAFAYVIPFGISSVTGAILGLILVLGLRKIGLVEDRARCPREPAGKMRRQTTETGGDRI